jgi:hypothetical protein
MFDDLYEVPDCKGSDQHFGRGYGTQLRVLSDKGLPPHWLCWTPLFVGQERPAHTACGGFGICRTRVSTHTKLRFRREGDAPEVLQAAGVGLDELDSVGAEFLDCADLGDHAGSQLSAARVSHDHG